MKFSQNRLFEFSTPQTWHKSPRWRLEEQFQKIRDEMLPLLEIKASHFGISVAKALLLGDQRICLLKLALRLTRIYDSRRKYIWVSYTNVALIDLS